MSSRSSSTAVSTRQYCIGKLPRTRIVYRRKHPRLPNQSRFEPSHLAREDLTAAIRKKAGVREREFFREAQSHCFQYMGWIVPIRSCLRICKCLWCVNTREIEAHRPRNDFWNWELIEGVDDEGARHMEYGFNFRHLTTSNMWKSYHPLQHELKLSLFCNRSSYFQPYFPTQKWGTHDKLHRNALLLYGITAETFQMFAENLVGSPHQDDNHNPLLPIRRYFESTMCSKSKDHRPGGRWRPIFWGNNLAFRSPPAHANYEGFYDSSPATSDGDNAVDEVEDADADVDMMHVE